MNPQLRVERLHELLADTAGGELLDALEQSELESLRAHFPEVDPESFERAAAALHIALIAPELEPLPGSVRQRLLDRGGQGSAAAAAPPPKAPFLAGPWPGWLAAAAASVVLLLQPSTNLDGAGPNNASGPSLEELVASADVRASWQATEDPGGAGVTGEVVWDSEEQTGFMRFEGLAANDPSEGQYQLWIFDADRPDEYPVDGGVFDAKGNEIVVPIDAKIAVAEPTLFAITYERPGGVVVSSRERLLLVGTPQ